MHESIIKKNKGPGTSPELLEHLYGRGGTKARIHWEKWSGILNKKRNALYQIGIFSLAGSAGDRYKVRSIQ